MGFSPGQEVSTDVRTMLLSMMNESDAQVTDNPRRQLISILAQVADEDFISALQQERDVQKLLGSFTSDAFFKKQGEHMLNSVYKTVVDCIAAFCLDNTELKRALEKEDTRDATFDALTKKPGFDLFEQNIRAVFENVLTELSNKKKLTCVLKEKVLVPLGVASSSVTPSPKKRKRSKPLSC